MEVVPLDLSKGPSSPHRDPGEAIVGVQITLGLTSSGPRDVGKVVVGLLSDRFDLEQGVSRASRSVEPLESSAT